MEQEEHNESSLKEMIVMNVHLEHVGKLKRMLESRCKVRTANGALEGSMVDCCRQRIHLPSRIILHQQGGLATCERCHPEDVGSSGWGLGVGPGWPSIDRFVPVIRHALGVV